MPLCAAECTTSLVALPHSPSHGCRDRPRELRVTAARFARRRDLLLGGRRCARLPSRSPGLRGLLLQRLLEQRLEGGLHDLSRVSIGQAMRQQTLQLPQPIVPLLAQRHREPIAISRMVLRLARPSTSR